MTGRREKFSAIFFAAVMIISMGAAGFAGSAAAVTAESDSVNSDDPTIGADVTHTYSFDAESTDSIVNDSLSSIDIATSNGELAGTIENGDVTVDVADTTYDDGGSAGEAVVSSNVDDNSLSINLVDGSGTDTTQAVSDTDTITVTVAGIQNPDSTGTYGVDLTAVADNDETDTVPTVEYTTEAATLSGTVTDTDTNAIEGATVEFDENADYSATTDSNGDYSIDVDDLGPITADSAGVTASADDYADSSYTANVDGQDDTNDFSLTGSSLTVNVDPGVAGQSNDFTYDTDVSTIGTDTEVHELIIQFNNSAGDPTNIDTSEISADQVSLDGDTTGTPGVDAVSQASGSEDSAILVTMADTFTLEGEDGNITVDIEDLRPTDYEDADASITFNYENSEEIDSSSTTYSVEGFSPEITAEPETVFEDEIVTVDVTVENHPDGETGDYTVTPTDGSALVDDTTDDGTFSFTADPAGDGLTPGDSYEIEVSYEDDIYSDTLNVTVTPAVTLDYNTDPAEPTFDDEVEFTGSLTNDDGDRPDNFVSLDVGYSDQLAQANNIDDIRVLSNGDFDSDQTVVVDDAGTFHLNYTANIDGENEHFVLDTFEAGSQEGTLTIDADEPVAGDEEDDTYTVELTNATGDGIDLTSDTYDDTTQSYLNVTGDFSENVALTDADGNIINTRNVVDNDGSYFHAQTNESGFLVFDGNVEEAGDVEVSLEVADSEGLEVLGEGGIEDLDGAESTDTLDILAEDDSVTVGSGNDLNVEVQNQEGTALNDGDLAVEGSEDIQVSVTGSDFNEVGATESNLDYANVSISSDVLVDDYDTRTVNESEEEQTPGNAQFNGLEFEEAGELTVEVTAENRSGETTQTYNDTVTLDVDGDTLLNLDPTAADAGESANTTVQIGNADGDITTEITNRNVTLTYQDAGGEGFQLSDGDTRDSISTSTDNELEGELEFVLSEEAFIAENVTFNTPGTIDLVVENPADGNATTINTTGAISVEGEDRYELQTDEELLAGGTDDLNVTVYDLEEERTLNASDETTLNELGDNLALGPEGEEFFDSSDGDAVEVDTENGTLTAVDVTPDVAGTVNTSAATANGAFEASGGVNVVEPEITTDLGGAPALLKTTIQIQTPNTSPILQNYGEYSIRQFGDVLVALPHNVYDYTSIHTGGL